MENEETKHEPQKQTPEKADSPALENFASELENIRVDLRKRKSEITTLKILFYTGLAVLLFGFMYTNQTLQRAQYQSLESHMNLLQNRIDHTLLLLEKNLQNEIHELDAKLSGTSAYGFQERVKSMNQALDLLEPQSASMDILIKKIKKDSNELIQMVEAENREEVAPLP
jgi:uncharacterized protein YukE